MFKKNIKPILMAGALALATAVSPVFAVNVETTDEEKCGKIIKDSFEKRIRRIFK